MISCAEQKLIKVGFEPTPLRTSALSWRLRPLGHLTFVELLLPTTSLNMLQQKFQYQS